MVFESVLTQVLNRVLGDYVENLDSGQLSVGIWGGDVELSNLVLKQSALEDLDLPIQTSHGRLGKLVLKIPWKNLYGAPVIITVEDVYLVAVPNQQFTYSAEKEEKKLQEVRKKDIQKLEEAKKAEAEKDKPKANPGLVEKLIAQIVKNVQLSIKNIHIRYEDFVTHPKKPFAFGLTMSKLDLVSTDSGWKPAITSDQNVTKAYKIVQLEGLAFYWNCNTTMYSRLPVVDMVNKMVNEIATKDKKPDNYKYVLGPINASARLRMNPKPEDDTPAFTIPKIHLNLDMEKLFIGVSKAQYRDIIAFADSMELMSKGVPYLKYRPSVTGYKGHYKEWWKFAYTCILEHHVKRRRRNWNWMHISGHRSLCKEYAELYQKKLAKTAKGNEIARIEQCEMNLDLFNIVIIRQRIQMEAERLGKLQDSAEKKGWFGWMWGSSNTEEQEKLKGANALLSQFQAAMTPEEKEKLFKAIDYQENSAPAQYPEAFVDNSCTFLLRELEVELRDDEAAVKRILFSDLMGVRLRLETRAAANAIKVHVKIDELQMNGFEQEFIPKIITSEVPNTEGLLEVTFETNPLDKLCGQRLHLSAKPLKIVYDAETVDKIVDTFKPPESETLNQLSDAASMRLTNIKEMSATGMQHVIDQHIHLDLKINLAAPYIVVPYGGKYTDGENVLVVNLGNVKIASRDRPLSAAVVRKMHAEGAAEEDILKEMIAQSYDQFHLELTNLQILMAQSSEDWKGTIKRSEQTDMHLLNPFNLNITFYKCLITDDPRLPLSKLQGDLPSLTVTVTDARLMLLLALLTSVTPKDQVPGPKPLSKDGKHKSSMFITKYTEMKDTAAKTRELLTPVSNTGEFVQFTTVDLRFVMTDLKFVLKHQETVESKIYDVATLQLKELEANILQQTYNTNLVLTLAGIALTQMLQNKEINIIRTPTYDDSEECYLFKVSFNQVNRNSPEFYSKYKSCEANLTLTFSKLAVILHQEGLLALIKFGTDLQSEFTEILGEGDRVATAQSSDISLRRRLSQISDSLKLDMSNSKLEIRSKKKVMMKVPEVETVKFKLVASLEEVSFEFKNNKTRLATVAVSGMKTKVLLKDSCTTITATLHQIAVIDLNQESIHSTILTVAPGEDALDGKIVIHNLKKDDIDGVDLSIDFKVGRIRVFFLNWFVSKMLNFLNQFQTAQQAIIEASQAAAESAKNNVQDAFQKATKISLNLELKAPEILIPQDSNSYQAILVDLGFLSLSNQLLDLPDIKSHDGHTGLIDELKMSLTDFKLSRIALNNKNDIVAESKLIEPLTFKFLIRRNLSVSWYNAIPEIDILGNIQVITLLLREADYQMMMKVLSGNIAEAEVLSVQKKHHRSSLTSAKTVLTLPSSIPTASHSTTKADLSADKEAKVHTFVRFTFTMEKLVVGLYFGGSLNLSGDSPDDRKPLGRFSMEGFSVKGRLLSDGSFVTSLLLVNCLLDDTRKGREDKLNRLVERTPDAFTSLSRLPTSLDPTESVKRSMIDITVQMKNNDLFIDVRVYSITVILSVEFLITLGAFFKEEDSDQMKTIPNEIRSVSASTKPKQQETPPIPSENKEQVNLTLNLKVEKPDIVLVEHMDNVDTNALILNSEILVKLRTSGKHQVINGQIKDLQLFTAVYNPLRRAETRGEVLYPVTISLAGSTPQEQGLHIELLVTDVRIRVSPATIELMSLISTTFAGAASSQSQQREMEQDFTELWEQKSFDERSFWFLRADEGVEAFEIVNENPVILGKLPTGRAPLQELCILSVPSIVLTVEAGVGTKTLPMLMLDSCFKGNVRNWSSQLQVDASLQVQMGYYNSHLALWEPLIEPVQSTKPNQAGLLVPWELKLEVSMNEQEDITSPTYEESSSDAAQPHQQSVMTIDLSSERNLEVTVTKSCLEVLTNLGRAFASAMEPSEAKVTEYVSPYKVVNELGLQVTLQLTKGSFCLSEDGLTSEVILENGTEVDLQTREDLDGGRSSSEVTNLGELLTSDKFSIKPRFLNIKVENCSVDLPVLRSDKRHFGLEHQEGSDMWALISDVRVDEGVTIITLRSIVQVHNHLHVPIEVYYMTSKGDEMVCIATVEPNAMFNVPIKAIYTPPNELFFSVAGYTVSNKPYIWKDLQSNVSMTKILQCVPKSSENGNETFTIKAKGEMEQVYFQATNRHTVSSTCYNIHLRPAVIFKNCLPIKAICCIENMAEETEIEPGERLILPYIEPGRSSLVIRLPNYLEKEWSSRREIPNEPNEFTVWTFTSHDSSVKMSLDLGVHVMNEDDSILMTLYCPFWMLNKTGLPLSYRKSRKLEKQESSNSPSKNSDENSNVLHHPANYTGAILFSFNAKNFFGKKKASVRIEQGEWSDKFSIDVAGSSGVICCNFDGNFYEIGVSNQLTYNGLTKQITFTPYYVIINNTPVTIHCQETCRPADPWTTVEADSCAALWPKSVMDDKLLILRVEGSDQVSVPFLFTESHTSLLKFKNKYGGINVNIQITEGGIYINITTYDIGMAPALIINHTRHAMNFWEKETVQIKKIKSKHYQLYTWDNPSGPRVLAWEIGEKKEMTDDLRKDGIGEYDVQEDYRIYWVSFLNGMQRILLFTEESGVAHNAQAAKLFEIIQQEITVSIHGLGLSLVNNHTRHEVMYIGIASTGIIWEQCKMQGQRYKHMSTKENMSIEAAYQRYLLQQIEAQSSASIDDRTVIVDNKMEVDFAAELMLRPHKRKIRRTFQTGLWIQMKMSPSQLHIHAKVNRLQIDNQIYDCMFPVILSPVPPPRSVAADQGIKPFAELSIVQLLIKHSPVKQFKYFKVLIQEFHIKVDMGFINALIETFKTSESSIEAEKNQFEQDLKLAAEPLFLHVSSQSLQDQKSFYDVLHFSPLKIHVSFSMATGSSGGQIVSTPNFISVLLQSISVTLTDMQDVVFKLAYFEREFTFLTQRQLISETTKHYAGQLVKQLYVLVLGLDVLGNPYGLVLGITKGVEDFFYEPFQGAIQGPGEFAEGLVLGVRSLFGHTVGGAAGAVSRITGAMGKGIAALTFDKDYQRKRRDQINKKPATVQEGFARSGKGLVMGVVDGFTGVFTKPISGAKEEGVGGFFKGLGKGAVGLVARPTAGVVDFASGSLNVVKRATEFGEDTNRLRLPRYMQEDGLVRPYNVFEASGQKLLTELEKGKYAATDFYSYHHVIIEKKEVLLLTSKRLAYITHNDLFGLWQIDWSITWQELKHPPSVVPKGVCIQTSDAKKKKLGLFGSNDSGKIILINNSQKSEEICAKIEFLRDCA